jgi:acetyl esterase/lipase
MSIMVKCGRVQGCVVSGKAARVWPGRVALLLASAASSALGLGCPRSHATPAEASSITSQPAPAPTEDRIQYGPGPLQFGHLRLPRGPGPYPVVVFIHGGCWLSQYDITGVADLEQAVADAGFAIWSLEYRRLGDEGGGWPGTFTDVARGADYLRVLAPRYALDLTRVVASGHSAGGQLALWLAARRKIPLASELHAEDPIVVGGVLALAPAADLEGVQASGECGGVVGKLMGGSPADHPERYAAASPMQLAPIAVPQVLVVGANDDTWGPYGRSYFARERAAGDKSVEMVVAPQGGHFDVISPETSTWPIVIDALKSLLARVGAAR